MHQSLAGFLVDELPLTNPTSTLLQHALSELPMPKPPFPCGFASIGVLRSPRPSGIVGIVGGRFHAPVVHFVLAILLWMVDRPRHVAAESGGKSSERCIGPSTWVGATGSFGLALFHFMNREDATRV